MNPTLFVDRDGTLIEEPADQQVDRLDKVRLVPGVIDALTRCRRAGYTLVMVTNQDGLGTPSFPRADFEQVHEFVLGLFASQGIEFAAVLICPHFADADCDCRKPRTTLVDHYATERPFDAPRSAVIGDRETDMELARRLGIRGFRLGVDAEPAWDWRSIADELTAVRRVARRERATRETAVTVAVALDVEGASSIRTGIGFFDHMLDQIARHAGITLEIECRGDLEVDEHHTVEDTAITLGEALRAALGDKRGIQRYGFLLPMDEALAQVAIDLSGRSFFVFDGSFPRDTVGGLPTELVPHFFRSFADSLGAALHLSVRGENTHHMVEGCFKAVGRALRQAIRIEGEVLPSTKGTL